MTPNTMRTRTAKVQRRQKVKKIRDVISNQMINPFKCEDQELINISTGHKATSADLICAHEKGLEALAAARRTDSEKVAQIKLSTFTAKLKKLLSMAFKAKKVYEEESAVVWNLYFVQHLEEDRKVEVFGHEWTSSPATHIYIYTYIHINIHTYTYTYTYTYIYIYI